MQTRNFFAFFIQKHPQYSTKTPICTIFPTCLTSCLLPIKATLYLKENIYDEFRCSRVPTYPPRPKCSLRKLFTIFTVFLHHCWISVLIFRRVFAEGDPLSIWLPVRHTVGSWCYLTVMKRRAVRRFGNGILWIWRGMINFNISVCSNNHFCLRFHELTLRLKVIGFILGDVWEVCASTSSLATPFTYKQRKREKDIDHTVVLI